MKTVSDMQEAINTLKNLSEIAQMAEQRALFFKRLYFEKLAKNRELQREISRLKKGL